jgi:hypothetical protein
VELCNTFMTARVLMYFNPARLIGLGMDASGFAIASIISQQQDNACDGADSPVHVQVPSSKGH